MSACSKYGNASHTCVCDVCVNSSKARTILSSSFTLRYGNSPSQVRMRMIWRVDVYQGVPRARVSAISKVLGKFQAHRDAVPGQRERGCGSQTWVHILTPHLTSG